MPLSLDRPKNAGLVCWSPFFQAAKTREPLKRQTHMPVGQFNKRVCLFAKRYPRFCGFKGKPKGTPMRFRRVRFLTKHTPKGVFLPGLWTVMSSRCFSPEMWCLCFVCVAERAWSCTGGVPLHEANCRLGTDASHEAMFLTRTVNTNVFMCTRLGQNIGRSMVHLNIPQRNQ